MCERYVRCERGVRGVCERCARGVLRVCEGVC